MHIPFSFIIALGALGIIPATLAVPADTTLSKRDECTFTGYTGYNCDGDEGDIDAVDGARCIAAEGRHSFLLGEGCTATTNVFFYTDEGCPGDAHIDYTYTGPGCYTVNTGAHWGSSLVYLT